METRKPIPAREKLAATLRFMATGETVKSIHLQFRHGEETVRRYIPEVCRAIREALRNDYLKVTMLMVSFVINCSRTNMNR